MCLGSELCMVAPSAWSNFCGSSDVDTAVCTNYRTGLCPDGSWRGCFVQKQKGSDLRWKNKVRWSQIISLSTFMDLWGCEYIASALREPLQGKTNLAWVVLQPSLFSLLAGTEHTSQCFQGKRHALKVRPLTFLSYVVIPEAMFCWKLLPLKEKKSKQRCSVESKLKRIPPL